MNRQEIWVTFAMGAAGQFPTARLAAAHADELLAEFDQRYPEAEKTHDEERANAEKFLESISGQHREDDERAETVRPADPAFVATQEPSF